MKLTSTQFFGNRPPRSGRRVSRVLPVTFCVLLLTAVTVLAEPVKFNQVQTLTSSKGIPDLRLNTLVSQDPGSSGTKGSTQQSGPRSETNPAGQNQGGAKTGSLLSGLTVTSEGQPAGVEIVEDGDVEGTICDCGEIFVAGGAFPKWPFLFLAAVPLVFISECDDCDENPSSTPTPTPPSNPTPTPTPTPEPASLLLFGTGLLVAGAGLRRRYAKGKLVEQTKAQEEE